MSHKLPRPWSSLEGASPAAREHVAEARKCLARGNPRDALEASGAAWLEERYLREAYEVAAEAAARLGESVLCRALQALISEPGRAGFWLEAGWALVDLGDSHLAITLLEEAYDLDSDSMEVRESLVIAYSDEGRHAEVVGLAEGVDLGQRPALAFPLAWSALMMRRDALLDRSIWTLAQLARRAKEVRGVYAKAQAAIDRYRAFPPKDDIRDWHFVQYGGVTLDMAPHVEQTGGRYNLICPDMGHVARVVAGLVYLLEALDVERGPWGYVSKDGEVLARALARMTGLPAVRGVPSRGWLVVGDPREAATGRERVAQSPRLRSFAFTFPWTIWGPRVADVTGLWAEVAVLPWNGGWHQRGDQVEPREPDPRPARDIAESVVEHAQAIERSEWAELLEFALERQKALVLRNDTVPRGLPYVPDAPLPSVSLGTALA